MVEYQGKNIIIMLTSNCNINCEHCYINFKGSFTCEELERYIPEFLKKYAIKLNGAENLTNLDYLKFYEMVHQPYVMTNGLVINKNPKIFGLLKRYAITTVVMSYHYGFQQNYSIVDTSMIEENIKKILENDLEVRLMCTLNHYNYKKVLEFIEKMVSLGVRCVKFTNHLSTGNATHMSDNLILSEEEIKEALTLINEARQIYPKEKFIIERCGTFENPLNSPHFSCYAGTDNVVITPDLNVYPCIFLIDEKYRIGKIMDGKIMLDEKIVRDENCCEAKREYNTRILKKCLTK